MGGSSSKLMNMNVPIVGLDAAGKSSIMHCITTNEESMSTVPTIGKYYASKRICPTIKKNIQIR